MSFFLCFYSLPSLILHQNACLFDAKYIIDVYDIERNVYLSWIHALLEFGYPRRNVDRRYSSISYPNNLWDIAGSPYKTYIDVKKWL